MNAPSNPFAAAVKLVLEREGPMSDNARTDPHGGLTRFGWSQMQHPEIDVEALTRETAIALYETKIWKAINCDLLKWPVSPLLFDSAVNQGASVAVKFLQRAVGTIADGQMGAQTLAAALKREPLDLAARFCAKRELGYTHDSEFPLDGEGWFYRVALNCLDAGFLAGGALNQ